MNKKVYEYTQVLMAYHSEKLEGCAPSFDECARLFKAPDDSMVSRHFKLFDYMLETVEEPLTERLIMDYHNLMVKSPYREDNTTVDKVQGCIDAADIPDAMQLLIERYGSGKKKFSDIVDFLANFEAIKPFREQCGSVGRMLAYKECLRNGIDPVVVYSGRKISAYHLSLAKYNDDREPLLRALRKMRVRYKHEIENLL